MPQTMRMGVGAPVADDDEEATHFAPKDLLPPKARRCPSCSQVFSGHARFCPFDGDPLVDAPDWNPAADALIGQVIDARYEVMSVLGEGGMGTVYEVRHTTLDRRFALKVLRRDVAQDKELTARFIQEAKAAASIGHPNIIAVSDFGELSADKTTARTAVPYFVMEMLRGKTLAEVLRQERVLEPRRAARVLLQCASALGATHAAGVLHRDLKPDNVFLTDSAGREFVKLLDFGVAKIAGAGKLTRAGMVFGTPHYMSPEQAAGETIDLRADIYSLGIIMYECFAGRVPFEADTYMGVLTQHMFAQPAPIEQAAPDPRGLGALGPIAMRCLEKRPEDRYATMDDVARAIELALSDPSKAADALRSEPPRTGLRLREPDPPNAGGAGVGIPMSSPSLGRILLAFGVLAALLGLGVLGWRALSASRGEGELHGTANAQSAAPLSPTPESSPPAQPDAPTSAPPVGPSAAVAAATATAPAPSAAPPSAAKAPRQPAGAGTGAPGKRKSGEVVDPWAR
jgi:eukaryotic-like serine/threonine-protein kinase